MLITGAAGWIGGELARTIALSGQNQLVLLDSSEQGIYAIEKTPGLQGPFVQARLGSVSDYGLLDEVFRRHRPQIVFHAAAFKHVALLEKNPFSALSNNSLGTAEIARAAIEHGCEQLILISTDKTVEPHSIMGASKRIAEIVLLASPSTTKMKIVRLGNVLESPGSAVPLFARQIAAGTPITVTHPEAKRYFMTVAETVGALLEAASASYGNGVVVPHLGQPVRLLDLVQFMHSQMRPGENGQAEMLITGLQAGEKLEEVLISKNESWVDGPQMTDQPDRLRRVASPVAAAGIVRDAMAQLRGAQQSRNLTDALQAVSVLVPEYRPSYAITEQLNSYAAAQLLERQ